MIKRASVEIYKDRSAEWRWRLRAPNGPIIADSAEGYTRRASARLAFDRLRKICRCSIKDRTKAWRKLKA